MATIEESIAFNRGGGRYAQWDEIIYELRGNVVYYRARTHTVVEMNVAYQKYVIGPGYITYYQMVITISRCPCLINSQNRWR